jgi:hypothetical protein
MTTDITLKDVDASDEDVQEFTLLVRALYGDGTSETHELDNPDTWDIRKLLIELKSNDDAARIELLSPAQRQTYDRFETESECRCDGSCNWICWHDMMDRERWLDETTPGGVLIDWQWEINGPTRGPSGSDSVGDTNTVIDEGPGLAGEIRGQVDDWF